MFRALSAEQRPGAGLPTTEVHRDSSPDASTTASEVQPTSISEVLILTLLNMLVLFSTQNVLAPNLTAISQSFGFNDVQRDESAARDATAHFESAFASFTNWIRNPRCNHLSVSLDKS